MDSIRDSGLYGLANGVHLGVVGSGPIDNHDAKVMVSRHGNVKAGEFFTLSLLQKHCAKDPEGLVMYVHTKGVTTPNNKCIEDWRNYMAYFNICRFKRCVKSLEAFDTCGVDWTLRPAPHYSGNYWWARAAHINRLPLVSDIQKPAYPRALTIRHNAEFWIGMHKANHDELWNSGIGVFQRHLHRYSPEEYKCS
jgi:hypothetical protein